MNTQETKWGNPITLADVLGVLRTQRFVFVLLVAAIWCFIAYRNFNGESYFEAAGTIKIGYYHSVNRSGEIEKIKSIERPDALVTRLKREFGSLAGWQAGAELISAETLEPNKTNSPSVIRFTIRGKTPELVDALSKLVVDGVSMFHTKLYDSIVESRMNELQATTQKIEILEPKAKELWGQAAQQGPVTDSIFLSRVVEIQSYLDVLRHKQLAYDESTQPISTHIVAVPASFVGSSTRGLVVNLIFGLAFAILLGAIFTVVLDSILRIKIVLSFKNANASI